MDTGPEGMGGGENPIADVGEESCDGCLDKSEWYADT